MIQIKRDKSEVFNNLYLFYNYFYLLTTNFLFYLTLDTFIRDAQKQE